MKQLFEPANIGNLELKNRFIRSATWEGMAEDNGHFNDKIYEIYENLAKGGVGAIITGYAYVLKEEQPSPKMFGAYDDSFIEDYKKLTKIVHKNNSKIILQLVYGGSFTWFNVDKREIWGPSAVLNKISGITPKEMSIENIDALVKAFGKSAKRAMEGGFDGVEIHAGHGYLLSQFLSPYFNRREDKYGGSIENRARIIYEVFDRIRSSTSPDFPILIKLNCSDFMENKGFVFEECKEVCKNLSKKGITAVEISGGPVFRAPKTEKEPTKKVSLSSNDSYFSEYAKELASEIEVPLILVGGNRNFEVMENLLNQTKIEFFSISRPLLSEPDLINQWKKDKNFKPRCTSCSLCFTPESNSCILDRENKK
ncbi:MAG: NADH:flavin oxidoreductase [Desulforegulaceae bacterium]|nr:NADH:flavin oxidoreductase [Desulforegulaceae bacterium]